MKEKTKIIILVVLIILSVGVIIVFLGNKEKTEVIQEENTAEETFTHQASGVVSYVDTSPWAFDGNALITLETDEGAEIRVELPARMNLCIAQANIAIPETGDVIEVNGTLIQDTIIPCEESDHYLNILEGSTSES